MYLLRKSTFFCSSTCHGAGRALSRAKSRRNIDYQQVLDKLQAQGISIRVASPKLVIIIYLSGFFYKVWWVVLTSLQVKSWSCSCNEIWILRPFSKAAEKTWSCFALDTEQQYWTVTVQSQKSEEKIQWLAMFGLYTLHLARPAQAKIQMLTASSWSVKILKTLKMFLLNWTLQ